MWEVLVFFLPESFSLHLGTALLRHLLQKGWKQRRGLRLPPFQNMETLIGSKLPPFLGMERVTLSFASKIAFPRTYWYRNLVTWLSRKGLSQTPLLRWKTEGWRSQGKRPSSWPLQGPPAPAGGIKERRLLASLSLVWLPGSVPGETEWARGLEAPKSIRDLKVIRAVAFKLVYL